MAFDKIQPDSIKLDAIPDGAGGANDLLLYVDASTKEIRKTKVQDLVVNPQGDVYSVNGKQGTVTLNADDVGAIPKAGGIATNNLGSDKRVISTQETGAGGFHVYQNNKSAANFSYAANIGAYIYNPQSQKFVTVGNDGKLKFGVTSQQKEVYHEENKPTPAEIGAADRTHAHFELTPTGFNATDAKNYTKFRPFTYDGSNSGWPGVYGSGVFVPWQPGTNRYGWSLTNLTGDANLWFSKQKADGSGFNHYRAYTEAFKPGWVDLKGNTKLIPGAGSTGSHASISVSGTKQGWAGIHFPDVNRYLMVNGSYQGFFDGAKWQWNFNNGVLNTGSVPWNNVINKPATYPPQNHAQSFDTITGWYAGARNADSYQQGRNWSTNVGVSGTSKGGPGDYYHITNFAGNGTGTGTQLASYYGTSNHFWLRARSDSGSAENGPNKWKDWYEIYTTGNKPSPSEIGAAAANHTHSWGSISGKPAYATRWPNLTEVGLQSNDIPRTAKKLSGSDLNSITGPGFYYQDSNRNATSARHYPTKLAGTLVVTKAAGVVQKYTTYGPNNRTYTRGYYGDNWTDWVAEYNTSHRPTPAAIGAAPTTHGHTWSQLNGGKTTTIPGAGSTGAYGSMTISGSKAGWAGAYYPDAGRYLMINSQYQGIHTGSSWQWRFNNGVLDQGFVPWDHVSGKPTSFTPSSHTHPWSQITGVPAQGTRWPKWTEVTGKPSTMPPSSHTHSWSQITGEPVYTTRWPKWSEVSGKPSTMPPSSHNHDSRYYTKSQGDSRYSLKPVIVKYQNLSMTATSGTGYAYYRDITLPSGVSYDGSWKVKVWAYVNSCVGECEVHLMDGTATGSTTGTGRHVSLASIGTSSIIYVKRTGSNKIRIQANSQGIRLIKIWFIKDRLD